MGKFFLLWLAAPTCLVSDHLAPWAAINGRITRLLGHSTELGGFLIPKAGAFICALPLTA